jgi:hypothetical protein
MSNDNGSGDGDDEGDNHSEFLWPLHRTREGEDSCVKREFTRLRVN